MKNPSRLAFLILLAACGQPKETKVSVVTLSEDIPEQEVSLSELMDIEKIVRLETTPETLLPGFVRIALTENHIITLDDKKILQFSPEGKFEKTLAVAGKGPSEFNSIFAHTVDTKNEILYYFHNGDPKAICGLSLKTGVPINRIPLPLDKLNEGTPFWIFTLMVVNDTTLACIPQSEKVLYSLFTVTKSGALSGGIPVASNPKINDLTKRVVPVFSAWDVKGEMRTQQTFSDTVYRVNADKKDVYCVVNIKDRFDPETMEGFLATPSEIPGSLFYSVKHLKINVREDGYDFRSSKPGNWLYRIRTQDFTVSRVSGFRIDSLGFVSENASMNPLRISNDRAAWLINADDFKKMAAKALVEPVADTEILNRLKKLNSIITESDNPILLVGKLK